MLLLRAFMLLAPCSSLVLQPEPAAAAPSQDKPAEPMSLERGVASSDAAAVSGMMDGAAFEDMMESKLRTQAQECQHFENMRGKSGEADASLFNKPWNKDMLMLRDSDTWGMKKPVHTEQGDHTKVAFLLFANDQVANEDIWLYWMRQAKNASLDFSFYIHAYGLPPRGKSQWRSPKFANFVVKEQARTTWCQMWEAQILMIEKALEDPANTHFIMLSSDSVPTKQMSYIYNQISQQPASRFCVDDFWRDPWPRAETWSVLRRSDAEFFADNKDFARAHLRRDCEEELAWYFPLRVRWDNWGAQAMVAKECIMFTNWRDGQKACKEQWALNAEKCGCEKLRKSNSTPAGFKHPVTYHDVPAAAFEELVRSPFWFARKFSERAVPEELKIMLDLDLTKEPQETSKKKRRFKLFR